MRLHVTTNGEVRHSHRAPSIDSRSDAGRSQTIRQPRGGWLLPRPIGSSINVSKASPVHASCHRHHTLAIPYLINDLVVSPLQGFCFWGNREPRAALLWPWAIIISPRWGIEWAPYARGLDDRYYAYNCLCFLPQPRWRYRRGFPGGDRRARVTRRPGNRRRFQEKLAERERFELPVLFRHSRFPGVRIKPLCHLSAKLTPSMCAIRPSHATLFRRHHPCSAGASPFGQKISTNPSNSP